MSETIARLRAHQKNIERYQNLLKTKLTNHELQYLQRRLSEERFVIATLQFMDCSASSKRDELPDTFR